MTEWTTIAAELWPYAAVAFAAAAVGAGFAAMLMRRRNGAEGAPTADGDPQDRELRIELTTEPPRAKRPLQLTDLGWDMMRYMEATTWAAEKTERLKHDVVGMKPYQVDIFAHGVLKKDGLYGPKTDHMHGANRDLHDKVSECAYEHGQTRESVLSAMQVLLRDELLAKRREKPPADPGDKTGDKTGEKKSR